ncbi:MAG: glycerol-3-phosphate acyltransferase [Bacteroidota bacterium]
MGSFPTAYLLVRLKSGVDIRREGSGNVGGFNAFVVTSSKQTGFIVGIIDGVKGLVVAVAAGLLGGENFSIQAVALLAAIIGHNYSIWLRFKGGRGLATGAGGFFAIGLSYTIVWCTTWLLVYLKSRNIMRGNLVAIVLTPVILALLPEQWIEAVMIRSLSAAAYREIAVILSVVLLASHWNGIKESFSNQAETGSV